MKSITDIIKDYSAGETSLEETNDALSEAGSGLRLDPGRNVLTEQELADTVAGETPEEADGWGLLDTGTGSLDKVRVTRGRLDFAVNDEDGAMSCNNIGYVLIGGKRYQVFSDRLGEVQERVPAEKPKHLPKRVDTHRRFDLIGRPEAERKVIQTTIRGTYLTEYDEQGYYIKSTPMKRGE